MGAWGVKIYQNDIALEVKSIYVNQLKMGASNDIAVANTYIELKKYINNIDDNVDYWLALASIMQEYGRLCIDVKNKALEILSSNVDIDRWSDKDKKLRLKELADLKNRLLSPPLEEKKVTVIKRQVPSINPNDIYYFVLNDDYLQNDYFYGYYVYVLVDSWIIKDHRIKGLEDRQALIYLKISDCLAESFEKIDSLPFFNKNPQINLEITDREDKRIEMHNSRFSVIKKRLNYVGNFDFTRETRSEVERCGGWENVYINVDGVSVWNGKFSTWDTLIKQDIVYKLRKMKKNSTDGK